MFDSCGLISKVQEGAYGIVYRIQDERLESGTDDGIRSPSRAISAVVSSWHLSTQFTLRPKFSSRQRDIPAFAIYRPKYVLEDSNVANHCRHEVWRLPRSVFCRCRCWSTALFVSNEATSPPIYPTPVLPQAKVLWRDL
jgi:hypothetical protein